MHTVDNWAAKGLPIRDVELRERLADVLARASELMPDTARDAAAAPTDTDDALSTLDALRVLLAPVGSQAAFTALLVDTVELHGDVREYRARARYDAMAGIQRGLARLRGVRSSEQLLQIAPQVIGESLGFDRMIISRVENAMWTPVKVWVDGDQEWADEIAAAGQAAPQPLDHMIIETEMARRRSPVLVRDVQESPHVHQAIASSSDSRSYVAAPIMPEGGVIGFLHADFYLSQRHPDEFDRDVLFAFAEAFGYVFERLVLSERLTAQGNQVRAMAASLETVIEEMRESEVRMSEAGEAVDGFVAPRRAPAPIDGRIGALLTARELEVTRLLATGATNSEIATRLVISEGTVKSHVKHILRKLHASNRAEAASKYMRLAQMPAHVDS